MEHPDIPQPEPSAEVVTEWVIKEGAGDPELTALLFQWEMRLGTMAQKRAEVGLGEEDYAGLQELGLDITRRKVELGLLTPDLRTTPKEP